ncbi:hypothetical protein N8D56_18625 [Devosia sp. A8/3-2]|nr:hypothetical protein N8D56_18625 [Devosia sp. A8/3-2]
MVALPFPTAFLYLTFGWKAFDDYATDRIRNGRAARPLRAKDSALIDQETSHLWPVQTKVSEVPFLTGNDVELLVDGRATFDSIFEGIAKAGDYLLVQFYIVRDDAGAGVGRTADREGAGGREGLSAL